MAGRGRPPLGPKALSKWLRVRVSEEDLTKLDAARETQKRSDYLRGLLYEDFERKGLQ
jgi:hypothetical protein